MTNNYKIHLGVETEVPRFMTGGNTGEFQDICCMTTKNAVEIWGGAVRYIME